MEHQNQLEQDRYVVAYGTTVAKCIFESIEAAHTVAELLHGKVYKLTEVKQSN